MNLNKYIMFSVIIFIVLTENLRAGLLINEVACATSGEDWVELFYYSEDKESRDISGLRITMYYGTSEAFSNDPVTVCSYDRPETAWDDRFAVIHPTIPGTADETDLTGDTNKNGYIDVYCNNYSSSFWSTDCVAAVDNDNDISNNGIIDFMAYSNRDGSIHNTIESNTITAQSFGQWNTCPAGNIEECMVSIKPEIGNEELQPYMTIARKSSTDTNSMNDFAVTKYMTPGKENILSENINSSRNIFRPKKKKIILTAANIENKRGEIGIFVYKNSNIRLRIFSSIGILIYESQLYSRSPGEFTIPWDVKGPANKKAATGLYIAKIEATSTELKKSQEEKIYLILCKYRQ